MGSVFKSGRIKTKAGISKQPVLQFDSFESAQAQYGNDGALILINRGLKSALGLVIRNAVESGADVQAAQLAYVPSAKAVRLSKGTGRRPKGQARLVKEAIKSGAISEDVLAAFLASQGVTP